GDNAAVINYGAKYLSELKEQFGGDISAALVAYNAGPDAVRNARRAGINPDFYTTGVDYSADVLQRAKTIENELGLGFAKAGLAIIPAAIVLLGGLGYLYNEAADGKAAKFRVPTWFNLK